MCTLRRKGGGIKRKCLVKAGLANYASVVKGNRHGLKNGMRFDFRFKSVTWFTAL